VYHVTPRHTHHVPAGQFEVEVPAAIFVKGKGMGMRCASVCLDHEALCRPVEVDFVAGDQGIDGRAREARAPHQLEEASLQLLARDRRFVAYIRQQAAQGPGTTAASGRVKRDRGRPEVEDA
jgi:hypothetical protein